MRRRSSLKNLVLTALFSDELLDHAELEPVRTYLRAGGGEPHEIDRRRVQLGDQLTRLYAGYEDYRPELLDCWRAGLFVGDDASRDVETWQRRLWLELPPTNHDAPQDLPAPLHVFGVSYMPRAHIEVLGRIAGDVYLYTINPCQEIWEAFTAPHPLAKSSRRYERRGKDLGPKELFSVDDPFRLSNPGEMAPLRLWSRATFSSSSSETSLCGNRIANRYRKSTSSTATTAS